MPDIQVSDQNGNMIMALSMVGIASTQIESALSTLEKDLLRYPDPESFSIRVITRHELQTVPDKAIVMVDMSCKAHSFLHSLRAKLRM